MSQRVSTILPDLTFEEAVEITKIHSIAGMIKSGDTIINQRPFRSPHHATSINSIIGGGAIPKPGEISLAHYGILYLDELPEFNKKVLEALRVPLEKKEITIGRLNAKFTYPAKFMLIASMNPCPCGYYGTEKKCNCSVKSINNYIGKVSRTIT